MNLITICTLLPIIIYGASTDSDIQIEQQSYSYMDSSYVLYNVTEYSILNYSDNESYVTFVCSNSGGDNLENMIVRYFCSPSKSFNLMTLLTDNVVIDEFIPIIGETFLKEVKPGTMFKYTMLEKVLSQNSNLSDTYILIVNKVFIESMLNVSLFDKYFFNKDELIIFRET